MSTRRRVGERRGRDNRRFDDTNGCSAVRVDRVDDATFIQNFPNAAILILENRSCALQLMQSGLICADRRQLGVGAAELGSDRIACRGIRFEISLRLVEFLLGRKCMARLQLPKLRLALQHLHPGRIHRGRASVGRHGVVFTASECLDDGLHRCRCIRGGIVAFLTARQFHLLGQFGNPRLQSGDSAFGLFQFVLKAALLGEQDLLPFGEIGDVVFALECRKHAIRGSELFGHSVFLGFHD